MCRPLLATNAVITMPKIAKIKMLMATMQEHRRRADALFIDICNWLEPAPIRQNSRQSRRPLVRVSGTDGHRHEKRTSAILFPSIDRATEPLIGCC